MFINLWTAGHEPLHADKWAVSYPLLPCGDILLAFLDLFVSLDGQIAVCLFWGITSWGWTPPGWHCLYIRCQWLLWWVCDLPDVNPVHLWDIFHQCVKTTLSTTIIKTPSEEIAFHPLVFIIYINLSMAVYTVSTFKCIEICS